MLLKKQKELHKIQLFFNKMLFLIDFVFINNQLNHYKDIKIN